MPFHDRTKAGHRLGDALAARRDEAPVVVGLPRGGVPVAAEVARALHAPLDVIVVRKLGVPYQPELAMGAVGEGGVTVVDDETVRLAGTDSELRALAGRVVDAYRRPFRARGAECFATMSVGVAVGGAATATAEGLVGDADVALYRAKKAGRSRYRLFDSSMRRTASDRIRMETALRRAVERDELHLLYQPVIDLRTSAVQGVEALLRWDHPELGRLDPGRFLPLAEEAGLMADLSGWVINEATRQAAAWTGDADWKDRFVAVNLPPQLLADAALPAKLVGAADRAGVGADVLHIEVLEGALVDEAGAVSAVLSQLHRHGVHISIDDFGTGYSSLAYLSRLPIDTLKIDRSFVHGLTTERTDRVIVESVISLGRLLGLSIVAEGVETDAQLTALRRLAAPPPRGSCSAGRWNPTTSPPSSPAGSGAERGPAGSAGPGRPAPGGTRDKQWSTPSPLPQGPRDVRPPEPPARGRGPGGDPARTAGHLARERAARAEAEELAGIATWGWDLPSGEVTWSPRLRALFGLTADVTPSLAAMGDRVHPDDRQGFDDSYARLLADRQPMTLEHRLALPDGTTQWVRSWASVETDPSGRVVRLYGSKQDITAEREREQRYVAQAMLDPLTGIVNRRGWDTLAPALLAHAEAAGQPVTVALLDLDHFKQVNDRDGHDAGDRLLRECATRWQASLRRGDLLARLGGEEFVVLLPDCDAEGGRALVETLLARVPGPTTASAGVAGVVAPSAASSPQVPAGSGLAVALRRADAALYEAKRQGRARVVVAP